MFIAIGSPEERPLLGSCPFLGESFIRGSSIVGIKGPGAYLGFQSGGAAELAQEVWQRDCVCA